jgi:hypothetical protein
MPTILNLLADGCDAKSPPEAATVGDVALLKGLYAAAPRDLGALQRMSIASRMEAELKKSGSETDVR